MNFLFGYFSTGLNWIFGVSFFICAIYCVVYFVALIRDQYKNSDPVYKCEHCEHCFGTFLKSIDSEIDSATEDDSDIGDAVPVVLCDQWTGSLAEMRSGLIMQSCGFYKKSNKGYENNFQRQLLMSEPEDLIEAAETIIEARKELKKQRKNPRNPKTPTSKE